MHKHPKHCVDILRDACLAKATRDYKARGIKVKRCPSCQLSHNTCICAYRQSHQSNVEFILLFHPEEIYKPTNTGRLIADLFPDNCQAYIWSRTDPDPELLKQLTNTDRDCYLLFPARENDTRESVSQSRVSSKTTTLIILDGSWKQARKMYSQSLWLKHVPALHLNPERVKRYQLRESGQSDYLATCEAASLAMEACHDSTGARALLTYFQRFNDHYIAMRQNRAVKSPSE